MTDNYLRQLCYSIEQEYWKRYLDDYEKYGESSQLTTQRFAEWQVVDNVTKQIVDSIVVSGTDPKDEYYAQLEMLVGKINPEKITDRIMKDKLRKWCETWRESAYKVICKMQGGCKDE